MKKSQGVSFTVWLSSLPRLDGFKISELSKYYDDDIDSLEIKKVGG